MNSLDKHLAILLDCPSKGEFMLFPDYYEDMSTHIDTLYIEVTKEDIYTIRWSANIANQKVKVFKFK